MNKMFLKKIKENLLLQRKDLMIKSSQPIDVDTEGDETDEVQGKMLLELHQKLSSRDEFKVIQINDALQKIEDNTYGLCQDCGEQIPEKRLLSNPHFLTCVACAEDREIEQKQRKRS
jgi:DnaK suppressor protein